MPLPASAGRGLRVAGRVCADRPGGKLPASVLVTAHIYQGWPGVPGRGKRGGGSGQHTAPRSEFIFPF